MADFLPIDDDEAGYRLIPHKRYGKTGSASAEVHQRPTIGVAGPVRFVFLEIDYMTTRSPAIMRPPSDPGPSMAHSVHEIQRTQRVLHE